MGIAIGDFEVLLGFISVNKIILIASVSQHILCKSQLYELLVLEKPHLLLALCTICEGQV